MNLNQMQAWPANAVVNNGNMHRVDPSEDWIPSPQTYHVGLPAEHTGQSEEASSSRVVLGSIRTLQPNRLETPPPAASRHGEDCDPLVRRRKRLSLDFLRGKLGLKNRQTKDEAQQQLSPVVEQRRVLPAEWKAYGYWARPRIGDVLVRNATPPSEPYNFTKKQIELVMRSVQGPNGSQHPDKWISRLSHPALPPRPSLWSTPPASPLPSTPTASQLQLNPFLEHRRTGVPPFIFDMRFVIHAIILGQTIPDGGGDPVFVMFEPDGPNGAQPASYPGVSALSITALADDMMTHFPWPATALSRHGSMPVTVRDVLNAVYQNFQLYMTKEELKSLTRLRKSQVMRAYHERLRDVPNVPPDDGVRRVDFLGDRCIFRGLEPAEDGEGFLLFVGPPQ